MRNVLKQFILILTLIHFKDIYLVRYRQSNFDYMITRFLSYVLFHLPQL